MNRIAHTKVWYLVAIMVLLVLALIFSVEHIAIYGVFAFFAALIFDAFTKNKTSV